MSYLLDSFKGTVGGLAAGYVVTMVMTRIGEHPSGGSSSTNLAPATPSTITLNAEGEAGYASYIDSSVFTPPDEPQSKFVWGRLNNKPWVGVPDGAYGPEMFTNLAALTDDGMKFYQEYRRNPMNYDVNGMVPSDLFVSSNKASAYGLTNETTYVYYASSKTSPPPPSKTMAVGSIVLIQLLNALMAYIYYRLVKCSGICDVMFAMCLLVMELGLLQGYAGDL